MLETFRAKDMPAALSAMRHALGDDAMIVSSETTSDGNVLVRAASVTSEPAEPPRSNLASFETRYRDHLLAKLRLKPGVPAAIRRPFERPALIAHLRAHRTPDSLSHALAEDAAASGIADLTLALAYALDKRMRVSPVDVERETAILLVGPHGAGKTAVAAKLAAAARLAGREVRFAATDLKTAGQRERLETFAVHLDAAVIDASTPKFYADAAAEARRDGAFLIADTAGMDPRDPSEEILLYAAMGCAESLGVVSATSDAEDAGEIAGALSRFGA